MIHFLCPHVTVMLRKVPYITPKILLLSFGQKGAFLGGSDGKEFTCNAGDPGSIPGSGRCPGGGQDNPLQYSCLENPMDGGAWKAAVRGVAKSRIRLSDFTFTFHFHALEKEMATHSSSLAWRISWTEKPNRLQFMGSQRARQAWVTNTLTVTFLPF